MSSRNIFDPNEPYVFVSYSHCDKELVEKMIDELYTRYGMNIWYDKELIPGVEWNRTAIQRVRGANCRGVILFASSNALMSVNVGIELLKAQNNKKRIIPINVDGKSFDVIREEIIARFNEDAPEKVDAAEDIIDRYLPNNVLYIDYDPSSDRYYIDIKKAVDDTGVSTPGAAANAEAAKPLLTEEQCAEIAMHAADEENFVKHEKTGFFEVYPDLHSQATYTFFGKTFGPENYSIMLVRVFKTLLSCYPHAISRLGVPWVSEVDYTKEKDIPVAVWSYFRKCLSFKVGESTLCLGYPFGWLNSEDNAPNERYVKECISELINACGVPESIIGYMEMTDDDGEDDIELTSEDIDAMFGDDDEDDDF